MFNSTSFAFSAQKKTTVPTKQEKYAVASMQVTFVSRMISFCSDLGKVLPESKMAQKQQTLDMLVTQNSRISMVLALIQVWLVLHFCPLKIIDHKNQGHLMTRSSNGAMTSNPSAFFSFFTFAQ